MLRMAQLVEAVSWVGMGRQLGIDRQVTVHSCLMGHQQLVAAEQQGPNRLGMMPLMLQLPCSVRWMWWHMVGGGGRAVLCVIMGI